MSRNIGGIDPGKLFLENGFLNMKEVRKSQSTFVWIVGGRGIGKTYGMLESFMETGEKFLLIRRTDTQVQELSTPDTHVFKKLNADLKSHVTISPVSRKMYGFYNYVEEDGMEVPEGSPLGYIAALSTFSKVRGIDFSDIETIYFDEFIKEPTEVTIKNEASALFNLYETVNRNREMFGQPPVKFIGTANSNRLDNPYFLELGFVTVVEKMIKDKIQIKYIPERDSTIICIYDSPISNQKFNHALYRLTRGTEYAEMAIGNSFGIDDERYKSLDIKGFKPKVRVGEITIYKTPTGYYASPHQSGTPQKYAASPDGIRKFKMQCKWLLPLYNLNKIQFESYYTEACFLNYWK